MKLIINLRNKRISVNVKRLSFLGQFIGLMFKSKKSDNLLFNRAGRWGIHSFFVFFPFFAVWLDKKNHVIDYKIVKPFTFCVVPKHKFAKLVELPINKENERVIKIFFNKGLY